MQKTKQPTTMDSSLNRRDSSRSGGGACCCGSLPPPPPLPALSPFMPRPVACCAVPRAHAKQTVRPTTVLVYCLRQDSGNWREDAKGRGATRRQ
jgi:hypothetical protein